MDELKPHALYIKHFGTVQCATLQDAQLIREEYLRRSPGASVDEPQLMHFATFEGFQAYQTKGH